MLYWKQNTEKNMHLLPRSSKNKEGHGSRPGSCWRLENEVRAGVMSVLGGGRDGRGGGEWGNLNGTVRVRESRCEKDNNP